MSIDLAILDIDKTCRARTLSLHGSISLEDFDIILDEQGGGCGICGTTDPGRVANSRLSIDHDHDHGHYPGRYGCPTCIRGVLCHPCNALLGWAERRNDTAYLNHPSVALYLARYSAKRDRSPQESAA